MSQRVRVLSVLNKLCFGGHEHRLLSLAKSIDRDRFDYSVVTLTSDPVDASQQGEMRAQFSDAGVVVEDLGDPQSRTTPGPAGLTRVCQSPLRMARSIAKLARRIRRQRIDVVEAHHTTAMFATVMAAKLVGIPSVITAYHTRSWESPWMRWPGKLTFGWADAVVTDSTARRDDIARWSRQATT